MMRKITKAFATFIVLARDEGRAELLAREYIKKEELLKEDLEILDMEEVPTDKTNNSKHYEVLRDLFNQREAHHEENRHAKRRKT